MTLPGPPVSLRTYRDQGRGKTGAYLSRYRSHHRTTPPLVWLCYGELSLKMIWDSNVLMTATPVPVSRLLATDQPQLFHKSASALAPHLVASLNGHCGDASCSG